MKTAYVYLTEQGEILAHMIAEMLENNGILCVTESLTSAALRLKAGVKGDVRIYVEEDDLPQAEEMLSAFFASANVDFAEETEDEDFEDDEYDDDEDGEIEDDESEYDEDEEIEDDESENDEDEEIDDGESDDDDEDDDFEDDDEDDEEEE